MFVCYECCVLSGKVSATDWSLVQSSPTDCGASLCVIKKPRKRGGYSPARRLQYTNPQWVVASVEKKYMSRSTNYNVSHYTASTYTSWNYGNRKTREHNTRDKLLDIYLYMRINMWHIQRLIYCLYEQTAETFIKVSCIRNETKAFFVNDNLSFIRAATSDTTPAICNELVTQNVVLLGILI